MPNQKLATSQSPDVPALIMCKKTDVLSRDRVKSDARKKMSANPWQIHMNFSRSRLLKNGEDNG